MNCKFITIAEDTHKCSECGFTIKIKQDPLRIHNHCGSPQPMGIIEAATNFVGDMVNWFGAGVPISNEEEKDRRLKICEGCEQYDQGTCKLCRCNLGLKVLVETSHCPIGKW